VTAVLDGVPDHRDQVLSDDEKREGRKITICCSRSLSGMLVLDL
jgi:vanillate O-demethylase ferredoxin subunit